MVTVNLQKVGSLLFSAVVMMMQLIHILKESGMQLWMRVTKRMKILLQTRMMEVLQQMTPRKRDPMQVILAMRKRDQLRRRRKTLHCQNLQARRSLKMERKM
uniref:Uncharacterized protein n=1 Tax=Opuntia streptacantha TaxID=393608 RepID=A0A7C9DKY1_OPUST